MSTKTQPWRLRGNDFSQVGWHTRPTVGYQLMFEFLRISPSYELARIANTTGLTPAQQAKLPSDFDRVMQLYELLGDVQNILFRSWWLRKGLKAFGNPYSKPKVHKISLLSPERDIGVEDVRDELSYFLSDTRRDEGLAPSLLISVPLGGNRADVLRQIKALLEQQSSESFSVELDKPKLRLMGQRLHATALFTGVRLLWFKSAKPKWENWRLGAFAKLSPSYSPVLDPKASRSTHSSVEQVDRTIMGKITSRALRRFENIAENAARGEFPSDKPVECSPFFYSEISKRIQRKNHWEKFEKVRITELSKLRAKQRNNAVPEEII